MTNQSCTIGIDMGTTSVKTVAFNERGREIGRGSKHLDLFHESDGQAEQDPQAVYDAVMDALTQTVNQVQNAGFQVRAVGLSAAMHSLLPVGADGQPLARAMTWMDTRAKEEAERLWRSPAGQQIYQETGTPVHAMSPLTKLLWMQKNRRELFNKAEKFVSLKEWVWHQWFDEWVVDASIASATGLYQLTRQTWDETALNVLGLESSHFSRVVSTRYIRKGPKDARLRELGLGSQVAFNIGASDGVLANLASGAIDTQSMAITVGTSCAVRLGSNTPVTDVKTRSFCYVLDDSQYIVGGPSNNGGIVLDWLFHQVVGSGWKDSDEQFSQMLEAAGDVTTNGLFCLPYVAGERAPLWNAGAHASFIGLTLEHTGTHLLRAAVEGILYNAYWIATRLFEQTGVPKRLVVSGKLLELAWVRQLAADIFGIPVQFGEAVDASVAGAVILANKALQGESLEARFDEENVQIVPVDQSAHHEHEIKFARYVQLVEALGLDENRA